MTRKLKAYLSGLATYLPGYKAMRATGGTDSARYCYSVWLRHLILGQAAESGHGVPKIVAELGPGDSIGIGLAALLCGAERYYALDVVRYSDLKSNLAIFDELTDLFTRREPIPGDVEFPCLEPALGTYEFPRSLLRDDLLNAALDPKRVADIRLSIGHADVEGSRVFYRAPWTDPSVIQQKSIDMIYSQAVLEHVHDLRTVYEAMRQWLKPSGFMSHQIDYRCHGKADTWNGHWTYSDAAWRVVVGRRPYLLNRAPHSQHVRQLREAGFDIVDEHTVRSPSRLHSRNLAERFRNLSERDLTTSGAFILAAPSKNGIESA